jgi:Domain of unknown function (DUF4145)
MKCPHCLEGFHYIPTTSNVVQDSQGMIQCEQAICPACNKAVVFLKGVTGGRAAWHKLVYPKGVSRAPVPPEIPEKFSKSYKEACLVLDDSENASAALSRRCLQQLLREKGGVKPQDLSKEIDEAMPKLPGHLSGAIDAVRNIGNFAAHPLKSTNTGEVLDVEPGEAEWLLEVLEQLFDFYFVQPAKLQARRTALNQKLKEVGKPPMK